LAKTIFEITISRVINTFKRNHTLVPITTHRAGHLFEGQLANQFKQMASAMRGDGYEGVISFESVYHPGNGNFEDGFRQCIGLFKTLFE
jgi:hypothetical protein